MSLRIKIDFHKFISNKERLFFHRKKLEIYLINRGNFSIGYDWFFSFFKSAVQLLSHFFSHCVFVCCGYMHEIFLSSSSVIQKKPMPKWKNRKKNFFFFFFFFFLSRFSPKHYSFFDLKYHHEPYLHRIHMFSV